MLMGSGDDQAAALLVRYSDDPVGRAGVITYLRIAAAVAVAALLAFIWWRISLSFSQADVIDQQQGRITSLEVAAARDQRIASTMADFRGSQDSFAKWLRDELAKKPLTNKVAPHVDPKTGAIEPCVV